MSPCRLVEIEIAMNQFNFHKNILFFCCLSLFENNLVFASCEIECKHRTLFDTLFAYEQKGDWYYWQMKPHDFPVITEDPRPYSSQSYDSSSLSFTPVTIYNNWPEKLENASIFPYLMRHSSIDLVKYGGFCEFVSEWYNSSCAVVFYSDSGESKIIGSGSLIGINGSNRTMTISTARHNFEYFPIENLYARFFQYQIIPTNHSNWLKIRENYLDVPIFGLSRAVDGLDAGYLISPLLQNQHVFFQYAKVLPTNFSLFDGNLSDGQYAMFHFAGGKPQVSIGNVEKTQIGSDFFDTIAIQAGPGASGATIIQKHFDQVMGGGISIYRIVNSGYVNRRIINFSQFNQHGGWIDRISAPYNIRFLPISGIFQIIPPSILEENGYEFLRWRDDTHINRRGPWFKGDKRRKFDKPAHSAYALPDTNKMSNHHIIPIDNLLYLWDYLNTLDEESQYAIREQVNQEATFCSKKHNKRLNRKKRFKELYQIKLTEKYYKFHVLLEDLCPSPDYRNQTGFAWSFWNLFKGWDLNYRTDDPAVKAIEEHSFDFSEQTKPERFNPNLWQCVKDLHYKIQILKKFISPDFRFENELYETLFNLRNIWKSIPQHEQTVHSFNEQEWQLMGRKGDHPVYRVKPS